MTCRPEKELVTGRHVSDSEDKVPQNRWKALVFKAGTRGAVRSQTERGKRVADLLRLTSEASAGG